MHNYSRNHQLYFAEQLAWMDRDNTAVSKKTLMKIESLHLLRQNRMEDEEGYLMMLKMVKESFIDLGPNRTALAKTGFFAANMDN